MDLNPALDYSSSKTIIYELDSQICWATNPLKWRSSSGSHETGSFSAAARQLNLTPSAVAKLIARLEQRLGITLFRRSTRSLRASAEGDAYYERARAILAEIDVPIAASGRMPSHPRPHPGQQHGAVRNPCDPAHPARVPRRLSAGRDRFQPDRRHHRYPRGTRRRRHPHRRPQDRAC